jgi:hypothetical protein
VEARLNTSNVVCIVAICPCKKVIPITIYRENKALAPSSTGIERDKVLLKMLKTPPRQGAEKKPSGDTPDTPKLSTRQPAPNIGKAAK